MARYLATAYVQGMLQFPIDAIHRGNTGNPDFLLSLGNTQIGVECVEVVPQEWCAIEAIRNREYPGAMASLHRFEPREHIYSPPQKRDIASGVAMGEGWIGDAPEQEWARAHAYFIEDKVRKLRKGNYKPLERVWLVMQDEWRVPVTTIEEKLVALSKLLPILDGLLLAPSFERVFICSEPALFEVTATGWNIFPLENWWQ